MRSGINSCTTPSTADHLKHVADSLSLLPALSLAALLFILAAAVGGIVPIVISWFLSPLMAALITLVLFLVVRTLVLRRANSTKIAFYVLPVLILLTFFINLFFILVSQQAAF
jgi:phosphate/sulfate permease